MMGPSDGRSHEMFLKVVLADRLQPQRDHQQHVMYGTTDACEMGPTIKTSNVRRHNTMR